MVTAVQELLADRILARCDAKSLVPAEIAEKMYEAQRTAYSKYRDLKYARKTLEDQARKAKKEGNRVAEAASWAAAQRMSSEEHTAEDRCKEIDRQLRKVGLTP